MAKLINTHINNNDSLHGDKSFTARLRRLKIQESIFVTNVKNALLKCPDYKEYNEYDSKLIFTKMCTHLKNSFIEMKNLFEDIKIKTNSQDSLDNIDMDDLKRDITQLESKMKSFKQYVQSELRTLQYEENIIKEKNVDSTAKNKKNKMYAGVCCKQYNDIVTSPVRAIINSPFKCLEVHEFQEFMKNSQNKCGGWNEYNHNAFSQIWKKYFNELLIATDQMDSLIFEDFKNEVLLKIPDLKPDDVVSHGKWYLEYLRLKKRQEIALNRWKENRKKMKQPTKEKNKLEMLDGTIDTESLRIRQNISGKDKSKTSLRDDEVRRKRFPKDPKHHYMIPTKQWIYKGNNTNEIWPWNSDIDNINKLHTPTWRLCMDK